MPTGYGMYKRMGGNSTVTFQQAADLPFYVASETNLGVAGLIEGSTNAEAANNATKLAALVVAVAARGGGTIFLPSNATGLYWWLPQNTTFDTGLGAGNNRTVNLIGNGQLSTRIMLTGTTGPFLLLQTVSTGLLLRPRFVGFSIHHDATVTSGADILQGTNADDATYTDVEWWPTFTEAGGVYTSVTGAQTCIETKSSTHIDHCRVASKAAGSPPPRTIVVSNTSGQYELLIRGRSVVATALAHPTTHLNGGVNIDLAMEEPGAWDLVSITDRCLITGGQRSIQMIGNGTLYQLRIDSCQLDVSESHIWSIPTGMGGGVLPGIRTTQVSNCWTHADDQAFVFVGGLQTRVVLDNLESNGEFSLFANLQDVVFARVTNCQISLGPRLPSGAVAIFVDGTANVRTEILGNEIWVTDAACRTAIEVQADIVEAQVNDNKIIVPAGVPPIIMPGGRTSAKMAVNNAVNDLDLVAIDRDRTRLAAEILDTHLTTPFLWLPSWTDATESRTLEAQVGKTITHSASVAANDRQVYHGEDRCLVAFTGAEWADTPDAANLSFTSGGFSGFVLANVTNTALDRVLFAKNDGAAAEYMFGVNTVDQLYLNVYDTVAANFISATSNAVIGMGRPRLYGFTYDGGAAASGIVLYQDNTAMADTDASGGVFTAPANTAAIFEIGGALTHTFGLFQGTLGFVLLIPGVATAAQMLMLKHRLNAYFGLGL